MNELTEVSYVILWLLVVPDQVTKGPIELLLTAKKI